MFVDSHCHLNFPELREQEASLLAQMEENNVRHALCISVTLEEFPEVLDLAQRHAHLYASVGVHPENVDVEEPDVDCLVALASRPEVVGIGETGLDYYWHKDAPEWQRERFRVHIRAARAIQKPLIIHTREAAADTIRLLQEENAAEAGGVMHCFTENIAIARAALDLGFYISFSGIVTFRNAKQVKETATFVPLDRLLIETDAPFLAPVPYRGKTNQPAWVVHVADEIARLHQRSIDDIAAQTTENFFNLFQHAQKTVSS